MQEVALEPQLSDITQPLSLSAWADKKPWAGGVWDVSPSTMNKCEGCLSRPKAMREAGYGPAGRAVALDLTPRWTSRQWTLPGPGTLVLAEWILCSLCYCHLRLSFLSLPESSLTQMYLWWYVRDLWLPTAKINDIFILNSEGWRRKELINPANEIKFKLVLKETDPKT